MHMTNTHEHKTHIGTTLHMRRWWHRDNQHYLWKRWLLSPLLLDPVKYM